MSLTASQPHTHTHGVTISYSNSDKLSPKWELHFTVHVPATSRLHPILDSLICSLFTFSFSFSGKRFAWFFAISAAFLACKWNWKFSDVWNVEQESKEKKPTGGLLRWHFCLHLLTSRYDGAGWQETVFAHKICLANTWMNAWGAAARRRPKERVNTWILYVCGGFLDEFPEVRKAKIHKNRTLMLCLSQYSSQILLQVWSWRAATHALLWPYGLFIACLRIRKCANK